MKQVRRLSVVPSLSLFLSCAAWLLIAGGDSPTLKAATSDLSIVFEATFAGTNDPWGYLTGLFSSGDKITGTVRYSASTPPPYHVSTSSSGTVEKYYAYHDLANRDDYFITVDIESRTAGRTYRFSSEGANYPALVAQVANGLAGSGADVFNLWVQGPVPSHWSAFDILATCGAGPVYTINGASVTLMDYDGYTLDDAAVPATTPELSAGAFNFGRISITSSINSNSAYCANQSFSVWGDVKAIRLSDQTPPAVTCEQPDGRWHSGDVSLACTASDNGSGLADPGDATFWLSTRAPDGSESIDAYTDSRNICDSAGNCTTAGPIAGNKIDKQPPSIVVNQPDGRSYLLGQTTPADFACSDTGSGIAACTGTVASGASLPTSSVGGQSFVVTATDVAGNVARVTVGYTVGYNFCLLYDPAKARQAGSTIPIKIQLCDANGRNLSSADLAVTALGVYQVTTDAPGPLEDAGNANPDLNFRFTGDSYLFNLSLKGFTHGTYVMKVQAAGDSTAHTLSFQVK